jgi:altronate dehydratase
MIWRWPFWPTARPRKAIARPSEERKLKWRKTDLRRALSQPSEPLEFAQAGRVPELGDNVAIAVRTLPAGTLILLRQLVFQFAHTVLEGHRFAVFRIRQGEALLSWGLPFGLATRDIEPGEYVCNEKILHALNERHVGFALPSAANFLDYRLPFALDEARFQPGTQPRHEGEIPTFAGFQRDQRRGAGTRNCIVALGTSSRTGGFARRVAERFLNASRDFPNVDAVVAVAHTEGGEEAKPRNFDLTLRTLAGFMTNPNVGAVLCADYGNEAVSNAALARYLEEHDYPTKDLMHRFFSIQGSYENALDDAARQIETWLPRVNACSRQKLPVSLLKLALQCGGSDAFSGVSGNPLAGLLARDVVGWGGSANLAETDELIGAETYVLQNVRDLTTAKAFLNLGERFQRWAGWHGQSAEGNPSGGNMYRGLYNITIKSIGAARKKDPATRLDYVIDFGERMEPPGFYFMDSPGNDLESIAGQVAAGCNAIIFSTGNGSITNFPFVPTIKVMTTTGRFELVRNEMDFNAGRYQDGEPLEDLGREAFDYLLRVASGRRSAGEKAGHAQVQLWREWRQDGHSASREQKNLGERNPPHPGPLSQRGEGEGLGRPGPAEENPRPFIPPTSARDPRAFLPSPLGGEREKGRGVSAAHGPILPTALVLPTSLCSGQIGRLIADRLNQTGEVRAVTLPHTEGCGNSGGESEQLFLRAMAGYLAHPLVARALLLEHGCEKTHNDAFRNLIRALGLPEAAFGWASVQMDGGIERAVNKALAWFAQPWEKPRSAALGIAFAGTGAPPEVLAALRGLAAGLVAQGGFFVMPEGIHLFEEQDARPTISYGQRALTSGVHRMECPTEDLVETLSGLGATGARLLLAWENRNLVPANPLVPTLQLARLGQLPKHLEGDVDYLFAPGRDNIGAELLELVEKVLAGEIVPRGRVLGNTAFQITRGHTGISL